MGTVANGMGNVTLGDVAAAAGVSKGTASRALTGTGRVSEETILRVRAIAAKLGYQADAIGRALRRGNSTTIGMVVPDIENPFFASLIREVESQLFEIGYELLVADSQADVTLEAHRLKMLLARRVDGVVIVPARVDDSAPAVSGAARAVPLVQLDRRSGERVADYIGVDNKFGMELVVNHLHELKVRTVAYIGGNDATTAGRERASAFAQAAADAGMDLTAAVRRKFDVITGVEGVRDLAHLPQAIVCGDDLNALGALGQLQRMNVSIPARVKITGFNGTSLAATVEPSVTTVEQPIRQLVGIAIQRLISRIEGEASDDSPIDTCFEPRLRLGRTTTAA